MGDIWPRARRVLSAPAPGRLEWRLRIDAAGITVGGSVRSGDAAAGGAGYGRGCTAKCGDNTLEAPPKQASQLFQLFLFGALFCPGFSWNFH